MSEPLPIPPSPPRFGLRTRLILSSTIITLIATLGMGIYIYFYARQTNTYLSSRLYESVRQQAKSQLLATAAQQAAVLNDFFASIRKDILNLGASISQLLSHETALQSSAYWDAAQSLARLPNGSWDNSNFEPGSVFLPARLELDEALIAELNTLKQMDFLAPPIRASSPDTVAVYFGGISGETLYYPNIDLAAIVPPDFDVTQRPWFVKSASAQEARQAFWTEPYLDAALHGLVVTGSTPVFDSRGRFRGVVAMDIQLTRITDIVSRIHIGQSGYAFLVDRDRRLIAMPEVGYNDLGASAEAIPLGEVLSAEKLSAPLPQEFWDGLSSTPSQAADVKAMVFNGREHFATFYPIPETGYTLAILVPSQELLASATATQAQIAQNTRTALFISLSIASGILLASLLGALGISNRLTSPLHALTRVAEEITRGNLQAQAAISSADEIGLLARALNTMTSTLRDLIQSLEQRVHERTAALEATSREANRRAAQFEALSKVARAIISVRNLNELLPLITAVVSQAFGYYHVGIFLNDENDEFTFLTAANSEGGQRMLARGHHLKIGAQGLVGFVAASGQARISHNVGEDAIYFNNPDLPETKSEAALPLYSGKKVIGVLDVQSHEERAFTEEDLNVLAILADQVSLALENANLFETTRRSLTEAETLHRQYLRQAWSRLPREQRLSGYRYTPRGAVPLETPLSPKALESAPVAGARISVPIKLRGEIMGHLVVQSPQEKAWSQDQLDLIQAVAERVAIAVENARLFDETTRRAERERLVTEITSKIRSTTDPQEMIRTALDELRNALGATQVQLIPQSISPHGNREIFTSTPQEPASGTRGGNGAQK